MRTTNPSRRGALLATALTTTLAAALTVTLAGCCCPRQSLFTTTCCPVACPAGLGGPRTGPGLDGTLLMSLAPKSGGLLGDTSAFRENPQRPGMWVWTKPGVDLRSYDDLLIEDVRLQPTPGSPFAALAASEQQAAATSFHATLVRTVGPYYDVVTTPGAHTLRVRVALVSQPAADGTGPAALEVELLDGQSQERLVAALGTLGMSERDAVEGTPSAAERAQRAWAARLLRYLDTHVHAR
jgi:hypothetical protein